jgi:hypothetical protein
VIDLLGLQEITELLRQLGERLWRRGVEAELYVVGGAAMALAYDRTKVTRDIDAVFAPLEVVREVAREMARERRDLDPDWLNNRVLPLLPSKYDAGQREALAFPGISVNVASPEFLLAMKVRAARDDRDLQDIRHLCRVLDVQSVQQVLDTTEYVWGGDLLRDDIRDLVDGYLTSIGIPRSLTSQAPTTELGGPDPDASGPEGRGSKRWRCPGRTSQGTQCTRLVVRGTRCWQHRDG